MAIFEKRTGDSSCEAARNVGNVRMELSAGGGARVEAAARREGARGSDWLWAFYTRSWK